MGCELEIGAGLVYREKKFIYAPDSENSLNPHLTIVGPSGSGKTSLLEAIIEKFYLNGKTTIIFDFHNTFYFPGENHIEFCVRNSPCGINPFEIDMDLKAGGPNIQAEIISSMFKDYFIREIGTTQQRILKRMIKDLYKLKGIVDEDPTTWNNELPTMRDLYEFANFIEKNRDRYSIEKSNLTFKNELNSLKNFISKLPNLDTTVKDQFKSIYDYSIESTKRLNDFIDENKSILNDFVREKCEIDLSYYNEKSRKRSFDSLKGHIDDIAVMSIFEDKKPTIMQGMINRIDLSTFTSLNKPFIAKFASEFILEKIFRGTKNRGEYSKLPNRVPGTKFDVVAVFDESKIVLPDGKEKENPYNPFNRIIRESRKYGFALVSASQRINHYSQEVLSNTYTNIILKSGESEYKTINSTFRIDEDLIRRTFTAGGYTALIGQYGKEFIGYKLNKF
jgi:DNA helicase HerA-like ATPase